MGNDRKQDLSEEGQRRLVAQLVARAMTSPGGSISEGELARQTGYSLVHVRRIFMSVMHETLAGFLRRVRLERAAGQLSLADDTVKAVAAEADFQSPTSFTKAFRNQFGASPSEFRELTPGSSAAPEQSGVRMDIAFASALGRVTTFLYNGRSLIGIQYPDGRTQGTLPRQEG